MVEVVPGQSVSRARVSDAVLGHARKRGERYALVWGSTTPAPAESPVPGVGQRAPPIAATTLDGSRYDLAEVLGRSPVVLTFWASWCAPCIEEAPHLKRLDERFAPQGLKVVSVSIDEPDDHPALRRLVTDLQLGYPVLLDPSGDQLAAYASRTGIPLTVVIDAEGVIAWRHANFQPGDENALEAAVRGVLDQR